MAAQHLPSMKPLYWRDFISATGKLFSRRNWIAAGFLQHGLWRRSSARVRQHLKRRAGKLSSPREDAAQPSPQNGQKQCLRILPPTGFIEAAAQDLTVEARVTSACSRQPCRRGCNLLIARPLAPADRIWRLNPALEREPLTQRNDAETLAQVAEGQAFVGRLLNQASEAWQQEIRSAL